MCMLKMLLSVSWVQIHHVISLKILKNVSDFTSAPYMALHCTSEINREILQVGPRKQQFTSSKKLACLAAKLTHAYFGGSQRKACAA
jgi:hypothetical protein